LVVMALGMAALPLLSGTMGYYLFACVFGFFLGGTVVLMPLLGRALFGDQFLAAMVGVVLLAVNIGSALGALLGGAVFDATGSYTLAFVVAAIAMGVASLLTVPMRLSAVEGQA
jgi:predicted MFS family arabinose efflux permease